MARVVHVVSRCHGQEPWRRPSAIKHNPLDFYANTFPNIAILAQKYLGTPATSAPTERA
mgnify:CR=1 FL=1